MPRQNSAQFAQRSEKLARFADYLRQEKARRALGLPLPNRLDRYKGDPLRFMTEGLGQHVEESWRGWRTVIKAAFGVPLDPAEILFFREVAGGREPPPGRVRELWLIIGRRGGKDSTASLIAAYLARFADCRTIRPGEIPLVACLATDNVQAQIVHRYIRGYFERSPELREWVEGDLPEGLSAPIDLKNRVQIRVLTNNFRSVRGYPIAAAVFDEAAFWRDAGKNPDVETYDAIKPGMITMPGAMIVSISSPYRKKGLVWEKWEEHYGKNDPNVLVIQAPTRSFNPMIPQSEIDRDLKRDPEKAAAEWLAKFREDLTDYVERRALLNCVDTGTFERPPASGITYEAFIDPSGGSRDSFCLAIGHRENKVGYLDLLREVRSPIEDPAGVCRDYAADMKRYRVRQCTGDRYAGNWPVAEFKKHEIIYEQSALPKSDIYRDFLPLANSGLVRLLDHSRMVDQFCDLERRVHHGGRDSIDHPDKPDAHDDICNVVAGVLLKCVKPDMLSDLLKAVGM